MSINNIFVNITDDIIKELQLSQDSFHKVNEFVNDNIHTHAIYDYEIQRLSQLYKRKEKIEGENRQNY